MAFDEARQRPYTDPDWWVLTELDRIALEAERKNEPANRRAVGGVERRRFPLDALPERAGSGKGATVCAGPRRKPVVLVVAAMRLLDDVGRLHPLCDFAHEGKPLTEAALGRRARMLRKKTC